MVIRLLKGRAGPSGSWGAGSVVEWDDADAERLIASGEAQPATAADVVSEPAPATEPVEDDDDMD